MSYAPMLLKDRFPEHIDLINLGDDCIWCWECYQLAKNYCNQDSLVGWHDLDDMLCTILKEYALLQITKLHDSMIINKSKNSTIEHVISKLKNNNKLLIQLNILKKSNLDFLQSIKKARNKTIVHIDSKARSNNDVLGSFDEDADIKYFESLHSMINEMYKHAGIGSFQSWPEQTKVSINDLLNRLNSSSNVLKSINEQ